MTRPTYREQGFVPEAASAMTAAAAPAAIELPETMQAMVLTGHGGMDKLVWQEAWPAHRPGPDQVLIRVAACGLNNTDVNTRSGWYSRDVTEATTAAVDSSLGDAELATCSCTTAEGMLGRAGVGPDDRVLITGASDGVGSARRVAARSERVRGGRVRGHLHPKLSIDIACRDISGQAANMPQLKRAGADGAVPSVPCASLLTEPPDRRIAAVRTAEAWGNGSRSTAIGDTRPAGDIETDAVGPDRSGSIVKVRPACGSRVSGTSRAQVAKTGESALAERAIIYLFGLLNGAIRLENRLE